MTEFPAPNPDWLAYCQLVQQLALGTVRRNTFSQWEMTLLLDFQMLPVRKSSRPEFLKRYLKAVHRELSVGAVTPPRLFSFYENESRSRATKAAAEVEALPRAS